MVTNQPTSFDVDSLAQTLGLQMVEILSLRHQVAVLKQQLAALQEKEPKP